MSDVNPCLIPDIWIEILKDFPVKTLGKCRCVCKSWNSLIVSPSFMAAHLKHYTQDEANSLLLVCDGIEYEQCVFYRDSVQYIDGNSSLHTSIFPFKPLDESRDRFHLVGSIYGLLCLSDHAYLRTSACIRIWNPLLQRSIKLPLSSTNDESSVLGFGYDVRRSDHRVVKISNYSHVKDGATTITPLTEVYSVQERTWRVISGDFLVRNSIRKVSSSNCFHNGVIYWLTMDSPTVFGYYLAKWALLFNVIEESFDKMKLPSGLESKFLGRFGIFEYQSKLSVSLCGNTDRYSVSCKLWVRGDHNVGSSWCQILNVDIPDCFHLRPVRYLGRNEELLGFFRESNAEMVSYDCKNRRVKGLDRYRIEPASFIAYSESLVLLDQKIDTFTHDDLLKF